MITGARVEPLRESVDLLALHTQQPERYPFLLESTSAALPGVRQSRYDILLGYPGARLSLDTGGLHANGFKPVGKSFLDNLDQWFNRERCDATPDLPFAGGWFLFLGYELAAQIEPTLALPPAPLNLPTALAVRCPAGLIRDRETGQTRLFAEADHGDLLDLMKADIERLSPTPADQRRPSAQVTEESAQQFLDAVSRIQEYIRAGDVFQVNLSRGWKVAFDANADATTLYACLRETNPGPFAGLLRWDNTTVLCSSPERLVYANGGRIETRPIAGTRPRVAGDSADRRQGEVLLAHPKERAEHIMLIDLERNDLGRVCEPGSVQVNELMSLESYAHVHHIVSNVQGQLRTGVGPGDIIRAVFPGGTITGCPKVRCMEIIAELEGAGRGAYTGSMGYLDRSGAMDLNILIRSLVMRGRQGWFRTGAGIVADSIPQHELEETRAKARGLLRMLGDQR